MAGNEKTESDKLKTITISVIINDASKQYINNIHDKVILQMLNDATKSDEPLQLLEKRMWNPNTKTAKFDVRDSVVLKLMYGKPVNK